jgi:hypothetical protein
MTTTTPGGDTMNDDQRRAMTIAREVCTCPECGHVAPGIACEACGHDPRDPVPTCRHCDAPNPTQPCRHCRMNQSDPIRPADPYE